MRFMSYVILIVFGFMGALGLSLTIMKSEFGRPSGGSVGSVGAVPHVTTVVKSSGKS